MHRRIIALAVLAIVVTAGPAIASADVVPFDAKAFAAAQEAGRSIVVAINAPW